MTQNSLNLKLYNNHSSSTRLEKSNKKSTYNQVWPNLKPLQYICSRLEVLGVLGSGTFGKVYKVMDNKTSKHFALKIIKDEPNHRHQVHRFDKES